MNNENPGAKSSVFLAILSSLLSFGLYYALSTAIIAISYFVISFLVGIPILGPIIDWIFSMGGRTPDLFYPVVGPLLAYPLVKFVLQKIHKSQATLNLSRKLTGVYIFLSVATSLIALFFGAEPSAPFAYIAQIAAGFVFFFFPQELD